MTTDVIPILRVADALVAADWYAQLGFTVEFVHRFERHLPAYVGIRRDGARLHLSEHDGDARPDTLVFVWVDDVDRIAAQFGTTVDDQPWGRELRLRDLDGNRLRIAEPAADASDVDTALGPGTRDELTALERAMWDDGTRYDRAWMDAHLAVEFAEFGWSGRSYTREETLDTAGGPIDVVLGDMAIRPLGRDAALVTYRSSEPRGEGNRASVWVRQASGWRLAFHQGTPTT
jgi:hypothetical protein